MRLKRKIIFVFGKMVVYVARLK